MSSVKINFDTYLYAKKSTSSLTSCLRYCKDILAIFRTFIGKYYFDLQETFILLFIQKTNFITCFFCKTLKRNSKLNIFGNLGMPSHTQLKNDSINLKKSLMFICRQKINFILHIFLEILERYCKPVILGTLSMPGFVHPK